MYVDKDKCSMIKV